MGAPALASVQRPLYTYAEADRVAHVSRGTARRWLTGYTYWAAEGSYRDQPPVTTGRDDDDGVSFLDLVEIVAIGRLKDCGFSLKQIREIVRNCQRILGVARPLTTLRFETDGREIFVDRGPTLLEVSRRKGQQAWTEGLAPFLQDLNYAEEVARRWWPLGRDGRIMVDPDYGFGLPVVAGSGVRTEIIREQFEAGEPAERIARDFNLAPADVEKALRFEMQRAA